MKILTVVGARPQFVKAAPVSVAIRAAGMDEYVVHTGQHYDRSMSDVFFSELEIAEPAENLAVGSGLHGEQTARMLTLLERSMLAQRPRLVLVYGDTNSTLAGALAACKLGIPIAHVEAGLRSFNRTMPEEHNRVLTDHCSSLLFCPTLVATNNLRDEGITSGVHQTGDVMYDAVLRFGRVAEERSRILERLEVAPNGYFLATIHRAANTDDDERLRALLDELDKLPLPVVLPLHPRTRARIDRWAPDRSGLERVRLVEPVGYLDMLRLENAASGIVTDSGGVQKEAYFFGIPCFTLRDETEWVETTASGWNTLVPRGLGSLVRSVAEWKRPAAQPPQLFGDGRAAEKIARLLRQAGHAS
jgi:UDP-N-acetylglucosamine 2-epimerase